MKIRTAILLLGLTTISAPTRGFGQIAQNGPSITVTTTCEAMEAAYCQGAFGFRVTTNGEWRAGPSPDGRSRVGRLTQAERSRLRSSIEQALHSGIPASQNCPPHPMIIPGVMETLTIANRGQRVVLRGVGGKIDPLCSAVTSANATLFSFVDSLMRRYYPTPFNP
jgi:hypothetical protein